MVRPEHAQVVADGGRPALRGVVENIVYLGTDTHFHVRLEDGPSFIVRQQNSKSGPCGFSRDERVGITISNNVAQVLKD